MPTTLSAESVLGTISEQSLGFRIGKAFRTTEKSMTAVIPILRETTVKRQYLTLPESNSLVEVTDTGRIDKFTFLNGGDEHVFLRSGSMFKGATQPRMLMRSTVLFGRQKVDLEMRCIQASHPIRAGAKTEYAGYSPLSHYSGSFTQGFKSESQQTVWANVMTTNCAMGVGGEDLHMGMGDPVIETTTLHGETHSLLASLHGTAPGLRSRIASRVPSRSRVARGSAAIGSARASAGPARASGVPRADAFVAHADSLTEATEAFVSNYSDVIARVEIQENQSGLALLTDRGFEMLETFDSPLSWKALHEDAVKSVTENLIRKDDRNIFELNEEKARNVVMVALGLPFVQNVLYEHKPSNGEPWLRVLGLTETNHIGEIVEMDGRVIHLTILRKDGVKK